MNSAIWNHPWLNAFTQWVGLRRERFESNQEFWFARSAAIYTMIGMLVASSYSVFYTIIGAQRSAWALGVLSLVLILTTPLHRLGQSRLLAHLNLGATSIGLAAVVAHTGGITSSAACWLLGVTPGITALLFRRPQEIVRLTSLTIVLYLLVFILEMRGYPVNQLGFEPGSVFERTYSFIHFTVFSLFIALALSIFAITQKRLYDDLQLNKTQLETTTNNLNAIFEVIHEAVFLVGPELRISAERSARFHEILGPNMTNLAHFFSQCEMKGDQKAQAVEAIDTSLGNDEVNFHVNEHLLPRELRFRKHDKASVQILSLHWTPVLQNDLVRNILVEIRDITQLMEAEAKARQSSERNHILMALLEANATQLPFCVRDFERLEGQLAKSWHTQPQDLGKIKAIIHTIKGNARSMKLYDLAETAHQVETILALATETKADNTQEVESLIKKIRDFRAIYHGTLAKNQAAVEGISVSGDELTSLFRTLEKIEDGRNLLVALKSRLPHSLGSMVAQLEHDLVIIAKELGKPAPTLMTNDRSFLLTEVERGKLIDALGHIVRNSMDHGIEDVTGRLQAGKPEHGTIRLELFYEEHGPVLHVQDDGRGLNLASIREKAQKRGLTLGNDADLAGAIFLDEFTTAREITLISGRGVGMASALRELRDLGGEIRVVFTGPEAHGFRPFRFELSWRRQVREDVA